LGSTLTPFMLTKGDRHACDERRDAAGQDAARRSVTEQQHGD
jgi:hypothetical protein